jgi:hypothetical protein
MPRKPIELPPAVARAFVKDMRAFLVENNATSATRSQPVSRTALKQSTTPASFGFLTLRDVPGGQKQNKPFSAIAVPSLLEFRKSGRKMLIRNEDISLQGFRSEGRLRRHRSIFQEQQVQVATSSDRQDFGK